MVDLTEEEEPQTGSCTICLQDVPQAKVHVVGSCLQRICAFRHTHTPSWRIGSTPYPAHTLAALLASLLMSAK